MSLLFAAFLIVHAGIHIGYICGPAWPFAATDPWLVTILGAGPDAVRALRASPSSASTFIAFLLAALTAVGLLPSRLWAPLIVVGSIASAIVLVLFVTPWTLPGLAIDAVLAVGGGGPGLASGHAHRSPEAQQLGGVPDDSWSGSGEAPRCDAVESQRNRRATGAGMFVHEPAFPARPPWSSCTVPARAAGCGATTWRD